MTKHEEILWELLLHEIETKAEQLKEFQLHKKQREESRSKRLEESCVMDEQEY